MKHYLLNSFPIPRVNPETGHPLTEPPEALTQCVDLRPLQDKIVSIAGRLAAVDDRYAEWAASVGVEVASVKTPSAKESLICEMDALVSLLYGLSRDQVGQVFASFHRGWDYKPRLTKVLEFYDEWNAQVTT